MSDFDEDDGDGYDYDEAGSEVSDDDENGFEGFLDDQASDLYPEERSDYEGALDESAGSEDERTGLFDMEASEDDGQSDDGSSDDSVTMSGDASESEATRTNRTFHAFPLLPAELREMIWLAASPDLTAKSRVFQVALMSVTLGGVDELWESAWLAGQTESARAVLATCRESRAIALKRLPDILPLRGKRFDIRCNLEKDVVFLDVPLTRSQSCNIPGLSDRIKHLALGAEFVSGDAHPGNFPYMVQPAHDFALTFSHLETLYSHYTHEDVSVGNWSWFKTNELHTYDVYAKEYTEYGREESMDQVYCWPVGRGLDVVQSMYPKPKKEDNPYQMAEQNEQQVEVVVEEGSVLDLAELLEDEAEMDREEEEARQDAIRAIVGRHGAHGFWHLPMVAFQFEEGKYLFKKMMQWKERDDDASVNPFHSWIEYEDSSDGESGPNEYESEGIDDDDISEEDEVDDDEDLDEDGLDDTVDGDGFVSDDYDLEISPAHRDGPRLEELFDSEHDSPAEYDSGEESDASVHAEAPLNETELPAADFSSPEPESPGNSDAEEEEGPVQNPQRNRRVTRVVESESDSDSDNVEVVEVARRPKRRIVSLDSEEDSGDGGASASRPVKRARVIVSDDEDED
jgi:hypothetical protein